MVFGIASGGWTLKPRAGTTYCTRLPDGNGSVLALTNGTGSIVDQYSYDPYGAMTVIKQGVANPFGFDGGVDDSSTGLVKFGDRYYNLQLGRWTQMDPPGRQPCRSPELGSLCLCRA